ncbi:MAG: TIGR03067 domain-containing protein [Planctomycetales bacterium]
MHGAITSEAGEYVLERLPTLKHPGFGRKAIPNVPRAFELIPMAGKFLLVEHPDLGSIQPMFAECPGTIDVHFDEPAKIAGRVVDEQGMPVAGVKVTVRPSQSPVHREALVRTMTSGFSQGTATTDAEGRYSMLIQHSGAVEIDVIDQRYFAKTVSDVFVRAGEVLPLPDIAAVGPAFVSGRIVDVDTDKTVACPRGMRLRAYVMGEGSLTSIRVRPDGTYRLPVLPGTSYVYFSANSLDELTKTWDVLEHPNPLTAKNYPVNVVGNRTVEVNIPVRLNEAKLGKDLQNLQGVWVADKVTTAGEVVPKEKFPFELHFEKDSLIFRFVAPSSGKDRVHEIVVDESKTPATIDITREIRGKKVTVYGIYKFEDERLWICSLRDSNRQPSEKRPTTFDSSDEVRSDLLVLTRKPGPQK